MSGLLPSPSDAEPPDGEPRVIGVDESDAEDLLSALSADTARSLLAEVHDDPGTPSELADRADTSLQNAQYHIEKLSDADLIEVIDTRYSEKGREMNVYGARDAPVVLFAGSDEHGQDVRTALTSLVGGIGAVTIGALVVQQWLGRGIGAMFGLGGGGTPTAETGSDNGAMVAQEANVTTTVAERAAEPFELSGAAEQAAGLPPGLLFFVGGILALAVMTIVLYARN